MTRKRLLEKTAAITGIGQSKLGRRNTGRTALQLTLDAALEAIADAGLDRHDIDGVSTWPGLMESPPGMSVVGITEVKESLGLNLSWYSGGREAPAQFAGLINAVAAVATGLARHVLVFRTVYEATAVAGSKVRGTIVLREGQRARGNQAWFAPYNALSASVYCAWYANAHFHAYGTRPEHLGQIALTARRHAALNPKAIYRGPLTMDDYMTSRMIASPLRLLDCDIPCDGSTAVIVSHVDDARSMRKPMIRFEAVGTALRRRDSWEQPADLTSMAATDAAEMMWSRTDLLPSDVQVAQLYDGFSILTLLWLEAMGFCGKGESGAFVENGSRIDLRGSLPLNTHGGQLSAGRLHGFGYLHEACTQLWGEGGARQVEGAPRIAAVGTGGGPIASCALLVRD